MRVIKTALISTLALGLLAAAAPAAMAAPPDESGAVTRGPSAGGYVYQGSGYIVLSGPPLGDGCYGNGFSEPSAMFIEPRNGSFQEKYSYPLEQINVFDDEGLNMFVWLDAACGAVVDGNPATMPPEPLAVGIGRLNFNVRVAASGVVHIRNSVVGKATTASGKRVHVSTFAKLTIDGGGETIHQLRVNYGG